MVQIKDNTADKKIRGRVLFTGNATLVIDDLMAHSPGDYQMEKCPPAESDFRSAVQRFRPHAIVACLSNETREMLHMYSTLDENPENYSIPLLAIGDEDSCDLFKKNTFQINIEIFTRPLNRDSFAKSMNGYTAAALRAEAEALEAAEAREAESKAVEAEAPTAAAEAVEEESAEVIAARILGESISYMDDLVKKVERESQIKSRNTILVVDDDVVMLNVIKVYLQDMYEIVTVPSGKLALKYLSKKTADLVLLDYMMPGEDGPTILQKIREESPNPNIPVLFLTGVAEKDMVLRGLQFHPNGYLLKPVKRELLLEKVTEILLGL